MHGRWLVCDNADMTNREDIESIERRMRELGEELERLRADDVDVDVVEGRVLEVAKAWGRAQMARAMKRADAEASEVEIHGERWGNRRVTPHDYETVFGTVSLERAVYQQSGRGGSRCRWIFGWGWSKERTRLDSLGSRRGRLQACPSKRRPICSAR